MKMSENGKRYFTLLELLIVIAIIAILAGMLLPALLKARESGQRISCVSNVHEIMRSIDMYTDDFKECYPPSQLKTAPWYWHRLLLSLGYFGKSYSGDIHVDVYNKMMVCPGDPDPFAFTNDRLSYGLNANVFNYLPYEKGEYDGTDHYFRRSHLAYGKMCVNRSHTPSAVVKQPSQIFTVADGRAQHIRLSSNNTTQTFYDTAEPRYNLTARHGGTASFAFADGHAKAANLPPTPQSGDNWKYMLNVHNRTKIP